jgi:hypothetical protein
VRSLYLVGLVAGLSLACGGLGNNSDAIVEALKQDNFPEAEALLDAALAANPDDPKTNRLLGDLSIRRLQKFPRMWDKNIVRAIDSYRRAVEGEPTNCENWSRLAAAVAAASERPKERFDHNLVKKLPLAEGNAACDGGAVLYLEDYQRPNEKQAAAIRAKLGEETSMEAVRADHFPELMVSYKAAALDAMSWETVLRGQRAREGGWFVVTDPPQLAKGIDGARDRSIEERGKYEILQAPGATVTFMDYGFGATLTAKAFVPASFCPGVVSWRISSDSGKPIGYCTKGSVKPNARYFRADLLRAADDSHWAEQSIRAAAMNPAGAREAVCTGGLVGLMLEHEASCAVSYKQAVSRKRKFEKSQGRVAVDLAHAERILSARNGEVFYGADIAKHLSAGKVAKGLPFGLFMLTPGDTTGCRDEALLTGASFNEDYSSMVLRCSADGFEFDFEQMALTGWRRSR